jgi:hypothetical protein
MTLAPYVAGEEGMNLEPLRAEQEALARKAAATMFEIIDCASRDN